MKELLFFDGYYAELVSCPDEIVDHLEKYVYAFNDWLEEDRRFVEFDSEAGGEYFSFGIDDVIDWFNNVVLRDSSKKLSPIKQDFYPSQRDLEEYKVFNV